MPTPRHVQDDDLILHYYGEMPAQLEAETAAHLAECDRCRSDYLRLQRVLGAVDEAARVPIDLPPAFERIVWARLEPNLPKARRGGRIAWLLTSPAPLALAAMVVALITGAFFAGRTTAPSVPTAGGNPAAALELMRERILLADLGEHLDRSQMALVELVSTDDQADLDLSGDRARAGELVADSRLYRQIAEQTGDTAVTTLLDDIERVLTEVAASGDGPSSATLADVRRRVESHDLLFKLRVVSSEVRERQKARQKDTAPPDTGQRS